MSPATHGVTSSIVRCVTHHFASLRHFNRLFSIQLQKHSPTTLAGVSADPATAPVGVNPKCGILLVGVDGSIANIANILACGLSCLFVALLLWSTHRRKAAVGRFELCIFLGLYLCTLPFQLLTTGSFIEQGSTALVVLSAIHAGLVAATFWTLLGNGIVSTQIVEDGTLSSLIVSGRSHLSWFSDITVDT